MTNPAPGYTPAPPPAPGYGGGYGYGTAPYLPPPKRPPLTARARRGALVAGGVGFALWNLGWSILGILAIGLLIATVLSWISDSVDGTGSLRRALNDFASGIDFGSLVIFLIVVAVVAILIIVLSVLISGWILRGHGVASRWGVTWAGLGISIVVNWVISFVFSVFAQVSAAFSTRAAIADRNRDGFDLGPLIGSGIAWFVIGLVLEVAVGAFAWWWMAHAMRPRTAPALSTQSPSGPAETGSSNIQENY